MVTERCGAVQRRLIRVLEGQRAPVALAYELGALLPEMRAEFRDEEEPGGLFEELLRLHPPCGRSVEQLARDHERLLGAAEALVAALTTGVGPHPFGLEALFSDLAARLRAHEEQEHGLLLDCHFQDTGVGD